VFSWHLGVEIAIATGLDCSHVNFDCLSLCFSVVWNIKSQEQRFVDLTPDDSWGGAGLLGVTIRLDNYGGADERLIRVLEVENDSPASVAGLVPMKDYLLGTTAIAFGSTKMLVSEAASLFVALGLLDSWTLGD
jgi:hypothetical protein